MFYFKDSADPVGEVQVVGSVELMLVELKALWDKQRASRSFWKRGVSISRATNFLLYALDGLVNAVNEAVIPGPDKKATVLDALDRLYDYTVREALPIWLKPVAHPIKSYVIHVLVSGAIDWVVFKYREGSWSSGPAVENSSSNSSSSNSSSSNSSSSNSSSSNSSSSNSSSSNSSSSSEMVNKQTKTLKKIGKKRRKK